MLATGMQYHLPDGLHFRARDRQLHLDTASTDWVVARLQNLLDTLRLRKRDEAESTRLAPGTVHDHCVGDCAKLLEVRLWQR